AMALLNHDSPGSTSPADTKRRRLVRKLLGDLAAFTGVAVGELAATTPPKVPRRRSNRVLFRRADTLTDIDLDRLVAAIGLGRWWSAFERATRPVNGNGREPQAARCPSTADMFAACPTCSE